MPLATDGWSKVALPAVTTAVRTVVPPSVIVTVPSGSPSGLDTRTSNDTWSPVTAAVSCVSVELRTTFVAWTAEVESLHRSEAVGVKTARYSCVPVATPVRVRVALPAATLLEPTETSPS